MDVLQLGDAPVVGKRRGFDAVLLMLVLLVTAIHGSRLTALPLRGEETRRGQVAVEMIRSGDWVVPRQQGEPFWSRPPLQNWLIAAVGLARGSVDAWAIRLPSLVAVLLVSILIYGYSRTMLSRLGAFAAAIAYATMGQVLELGPIGETESLFTLLVSGSLLVWHWGRVREWPPVCTWSAAYVFVALGILAKGPQAPAYFAAAVGVFLLLSGRIREAFTRAHAAGILVLLAVWGAWQLPFYLDQGWEGVKGIYGGDVALRFVDSRWTTVLKHLASYPLEILACLVPWSVLLLAYANRDFRKTIGAAREQVLFLCVCIAVTFPTCWFPPGAKTRYFMSLYPCFAILVGLVVDRIAQPAVGMEWARLWRYFMSGMAALMALAGLLVLAASWLGEEGTVFSQPWWVASGFAAASAMLAVATWQSHRRGTIAGAYAATACLALFLGLLWNVPIINGKLRLSEDAPELAIADLKQRLPAGTQLVSLGPIDHVFAYYYRDPVEIVAVPTRGAGLAPEIEYFCFSLNADVPPPPDAATLVFEELTRVSCRAQRKGPERSVIVARRTRP